ncbi:MarR family transcriptional regulator [Vibrio coralliilyticus]|uniref:MarR family transcriptional regulator n=1 Tax=Vibrio coralliilyticus TaxID=190893 RepID=A0A837G4Z6_9VIBR|nr:bifunctional helix-turn-helix transcriptional regulator/GNAT family N-acetyltransferase [Vibrio coralliilyticus]KJY70115.1 MarR family transcriptional regulator [Vibrio coralliilyticus]QOU32527.1 MarR family transcriptional regulator [Vibrio coralliilyticus]
MDNMNNTVNEIRSFNRFHTNLVGALNEGLLASSFPLVQVRILFELANNDDLAASDLMESLSVDRGYLSRMVSSLDKQGLITKTPDAKNKKRIVLSLSPEGQKVFAELNNASASEVQALISSLSKNECTELISALKKVRRLLGDPSIKREYKLREPQSGDMGWITHRQGLLYKNEYQWDWQFEALVSQIVGEFVINYNPEVERCWVAEMDGEVVGSVFIVRQDDTTAKLRLLYVEEAARGLGLGRKLVDECVQFSREKGYKRIEFWTNSVLVSARRIYEAAGFKLIKEEPHHSFGQDLVGQTWALDL